MKNRTLSIKNLAEYTKVDAAYPALMNGTACDNSSLAQQLVAPITYADAVSTVSAVDGSIACARADSLDMAVLWQRMLE